MSENNLFGASRAAIDLFVQADNDTRQIQVFCTKVEMGHNCQSGSGDGNPYIVNIYKVHQVNRAAVSPHYLHSSLAVTICTAVASLPINLQYSAPTCSTGTTSSSGKQPGSHIGSPRYRS